MQQQEIGACLSSVGVSIFLQHKNHAIDEAYAEELRQRLSACSLSVVVEQAPHRQQMLAVPPHGDRMPPLLPRSGLNHAPRFGSGFYNGSADRSWNGLKRLPQQRGDGSSGVSSGVSSEVSSGVSSGVRCRPSGNGCNLRGMLNKLSKSNMDVLKDKIISTVLAAGDDDLLVHIKDIIAHSIKQPVYHSLFVRVLAEVMAAKPDLRRRAAIQDAVAATINIGGHLAASLQDILEGGGQDPQTDYDAFCDHTKHVAKLLSTVGLVVACHQERLLSADLLRGYVSSIRETLERPASSMSVPMVDTLIDVVEAFIVACLKKGDTASQEEYMMIWWTDASENQLCAWHDRFQGLELLSNRARFKLLSLIQLTGGGTARAREDLAHKAREKR